jgi:hypothetical protein
MSCFIASNQNRVYSALESEFGRAAVVTGLDRLPFSTFRLRERRTQVSIRDKTGSRTYPGPSNGRDTAMVESHLPD